MSPFLIHLGADDCYRVPVLKEAGFCVEEFRSVGRLHSALLQFPEPDAVAIAESDEIEARETMFLVQSSCAAPLILFQGRNRCFETSGFSLVIPPLTEPRVWLNDLVVLIEHTRMIRSQSRSICAQSTLLRRQVAEAVARSRRERQRSESLTGRSRLANPYNER
jgi:hypothetical protein